MTAADAARFLSGPGRPALARFLSRQRWFAARGRGPSAVEIAGWAAVGERPSILLTLVTADDERYYMPVAVSARATAPSLDPAAEIDTSGDAVLYDAHL